MSGMALVPYEGGGNGRDSPRDLPPALKAKEERWYEAWRRSMLGQGLRGIAKDMGVSYETARRYVKNWEGLAAGSMEAVAERQHQAAVLADLEQKLYREAGGKDGSWVAATGPLRGVLADRRELCGVGSSSKQVTVELGAAATAGGVDGVPQALGSVLARVTISDGNEAA